MTEWNLPYADLRRSWHAAIQPQLDSVWKRSRFYQELWQAPPSAEAFESLPLVQKKDFHIALESGFLGSNLACPEEDVAHIHASSGTSGRPTYFGLTEKDYDAWMRIFTRGFQLGGVKSGDRVLHGFAMSRGYAGGVPMIDAFEAMGCTALPIGAEAGSVRLIDAIHRLRPNVLYLSPSMARRLGQVYADEVGVPASSSSVKLILTGGEPGAGDPESKRQLGEMWGADIRECGGGTDVSPLMFSECEAHDGLHFVAGDEVMFELIDPDTGTVLDLSAGAEGEIVYTHLDREANPVVRMRHGDVVRVDTSPCSCGCHAPRIWFRGRSDDMLIVRGVKVFPSSIQAAVSQFAPELNGAFAVRRSRTGATESVLRIVCESAVADPSPDMREQIERRVRDIVGVRVECEFASVGSLTGEGAQKAKGVIYDD